MKNSKRDNTNVAVKTKFKRGNQISYEWIEKAILDVPDKANIRCVLCAGSIRIHRQKFSGGNKDHAEHKYATDSKFCPNGEYFCGEFRISAKPVT